MSKFFNKVRKMFKSVEENQEYTLITDKIRKLPKAEYAAVLYRKEHEPRLIVIRNGDTKILKISNKVAEELISMGLSYGD